MPKPSLSENEKKILLALIEGFPLVSRPFAEIARNLNLDEEEVIKVVQNLLNKGVIRRLGATIRHNLAGYKGNAMVAWIVPEERLEEVGRILAQRPFVSHCYVRKTYPHWPYNLYTMCHAKTKEELVEIIKSCSQELNLPQYEMLFTVREIRRKHAQYKME
ncbi:MAG: Lrp/AsnC family transcriptional regulator [Caldimicrobium sp.]|nr:Lrp/AsnC family transcriptional regulator [Caldimicrobium sp.]MCX7613500.1 Lrp/AsnC family transcriptional regulator [Caldimicrobium sp.]MDW8182458.1 Lrp/AsnC family transcriptional regulator [Caldimicrobium sp.]